MAAHALHAPRYRPAAAADWRMLVVVPAHDEERLIGGCLRSLAVAAAAWDAARTRLVVVADRCSDRTAEIAGRYLGPGDLLILAEAGSAAAARDIGCAVALGEHPLHRTWIASTDADTTVPPAWLLNNARHASSGADAVAGVVSLSDDAPPALRAAFEAAYAVGLDAHRHVHAANIGIRGDVFVAAGGWGNLACGEDGDLWRRAAELGFRLESCPRTTVVTSHRLHSRVPDGFARDLRLLAGG